MSTIRLPQLQLCLLGGWRFSIDGRSTGPDYDKGRALLAYLAMEPRWHARDWLAALFWPDAEKQRSNLRQVLSNLRTALGDKDASTPLLLVERNAVRFNPAWTHALDVNVFTTQVPTCVDAPNQVHCHHCTEGMEAIVGLYTGEFLAGFALPDCAEFENWGKFQRESLHRQALTLLARLADCHTQAGNHGRALVFTRRHVELEPWDEVQQRRLMDLYAKGGQALAAIQHYEAFAALLLSELGVQPEDATRQLYAEIRASRTSISNIQAPPSLLPLPVAERRQVTVLYCELTADGEDPEEVLEHLRTSQRRATEQIRQQGGHIVQSHGGGLLVYFGYPHAQEDAARRALGTALSIVRMLPPTVHGRFGAHTGLIVTSDDPAVPDAIGETSRLAIKLRQLSGAGEIAVSASSCRLTSGFFHFKNLGKHHLLDNTPVIDAFLVLAETGAGLRLEAAAQLTPFVGRYSELNELIACWRRTLDSGRLHGVLLRGDAGIGKSRLLWQFKTEVGSASMQVRELRCRAEYANTALHPISEHLSSNFGFTTGEHDDTRLDKIEAHLTEQFPAAPADTGQLLARLLLLPTTTRYGAPTLAPAQEKDRLNELLQQLLCHLADQTPLLLIVEDMHWADPSTQELIAKLLDTPPHHPILLLLTARPEFQAPREQEMVQIQLGPLSSQEASALIDSLNRDQPIGDASTQHILQATDGVPLFIEEMTHLLRSTGSSITPPSFIPATLHDLLMARLDQLGQARILAQQAAVIGREFERKLLFRLSANDAVGTNRLLAQLEASGLARKLGDANTERYQFKHALIREAAYHSLSRQSRRDAHQRIAQALLPAATAGTEAPELLARHFHAANMMHEACTWWLRAGAESAARCAYTEAIEHFRQALAAVAALSEKPERDALELQIQVKLGYVLLANQGYGSREASRAYDRALTLGESTGTSLAVFLAYWGLYLGSSSRTHHGDAMRLAERMLDMAQQESCPEWLIVAHYACANSAYSLGRFALSRTHAAGAKQHYRPELDQQLLNLFGEHAWVSALFFDAWSLWAMDEPAQARQTAIEGVAQAQRIGHPQTLCFAHCFAGVLYRLLDEPALVAQSGAELSCLANKHGLAFWKVVSELFLGWSQAAAGDAAGIIRITDAIAAIRAGVFIGAVMYFLEMLAEAHAMLGQHQEQLQVIDEALEIMAKIHDTHAEAEYYRIKGECLLCLDGDPTEARAWMQCGLEVARRQGAGMLEKRAIASLAKLDARSV